MVFDFKNKIVLVTGSTRGLGNAIARTFWDHGATVVYNGRSHINNASNVPIGLDRVHYIQGDLTKLSDVDNLRDLLKRNFEKVDIVVCNVGDGRSVPPGKEFSDEWDRMLEINLKSTTNVVESLAETISPAGVITCISSICGLRALSAPIPYSVAKAALNHYVKCKARDLSKSQIRINALAPGNLFFPGSTWEVKIQENRGEVERMLLEDVPLGRFGNLDEIAQWVLHLSSPVSNFVTGQVLAIDGGQT